MSNFDAQGRLEVVTPANIGPAGSDAAGAEQVYAVPATWTLNALIQGPTGVISRAGIGGKSHYVCGVQTSINGPAGGDTYLSYGAPEGTDLLHTYGAFQLVFDPPIQVPVGYEVNLGFLNSAAGTYFRLNMWGYTI